jgi:NitT/TauT family transport system substrate-binding protein
MLGIGMIALGLAAAGLAQAQEAASLRLNWLYYGFHSFFPLGVEKGFYKEEGIDLTIGEGQGSGRAVQIVGAKSDTFGLSDGASVIAGAAKGAPVVAVMGIMNKSPFAIIARADANIRTVKDLEGKTIAATTGEAGLTIFPAIIKNNKLNADAIKFVRVDGPGKLVATLEKRVDAMLGGLENQSLILAQRGLAVTNIAYSDVGANTLGLVIHVNKETLEKNPKLVQGFIRATQKSIAYTEKNPEEAIAALARIKPDLDKGLAMQQLKAGLQLVRAKDGENRPIGWMNPADWETTLDMAREYQDLKTEMKATDFYVNNLVAAKQ